MGRAARRSRMGARRTPAGRAGLLCLAAWLTTCAARADPPPANDARRAEKATHDCPVATAVGRSAVLNDVARDLSRGDRLSDAIERRGYPAARSETLYLKGPMDDAAIRHLIEDRYCGAVGQPRFTDAGLYRRGDEAWIVLAVRIDLPAVEDAAVIAARVLELVNAARAQPRRCGRRRLDAAPPLTLSRELTEAAARHARDMARRGTLDHRGSDGSRPDERVSRTGYRWRAIGENIAAGQSSAEAAVASWLDSPEHCGNVMGPQYTEMGVAFAPSSKAMLYWVQVFAAPP